VLYVLSTSIYGLYFIHKSYSFIWYSDISIYTLNMDSVNYDMIGSTPLTISHSDHLAPPTLTYALPQLSHTHFHNSNKLATNATLTCSVLLLICLLSQLWHIQLYSFDIIGLTALTCSVSSLWQSDMAGSNLVGVTLAWLVEEKLAWLVAVDLDSLEACW